LAESSKLKQLPLHLVLTVPLVILMAGSVGLTGWLSWQSGKQAVNDVAGQFRQQVGDRIKQKLTSYLETPHLINRINADAVQRGQLNVQDRNSDHYLWNQIQLFDSATWIYYGSQQGGEFTGITRFLEDRSLEIVIADPTSRYQSFYYNLDTQGNRRQRVKVDPNKYDSRLRPWYQTAIKARKAFWSPVYQSFAEPDLTLTAALPVYGANGKLKGVVGTDIYLEEISRFLSDLKISSSGQTFIVERSGLLVASSTDESPYTLNKDTQKTKRLRAINSQKLLIRSTMQQLTKQFDLQLTRIDAPKEITFSLNSQRHFAQVLPFEDERGLDWLIVVAMPESDFMAQMNANRVDTLWFGALGLLGAIVLGILITRRLSQSIQQLTVASQAIARGELNREVPTANIKELNILSQSFNQMAEQLAQSFAALERSNTELEKNVEERTAALRQSEEKFSKAFSASPYPIAIFRRSDKQVMEVNESYLFHTEYSLNEVVGQNITKLQLWTNPQDPVQIAELLGTQGYVRNLEINYRRKAGKIGTALLSAELVELNGEPCILAVHNDITHLKQAEQELNLAKQAAETANRAKSDFLANMSHELRTPLNIILGFTQLMVRDPSLTATQLSHLKIVNNSGEHLLELINDVLDMSKIEAGRVLVNETSLDLHHFLSTLVDMFQFKANVKGLQLICDRESAVPQYITIDESKLRQVLINLLGNAIKFTEEGSVTMRVSAQRPENSMSEGEVSQSLLAFEVIDTGPGIPETEQERIFEAFVQTESGRQSQTGTGLGLPISRKFVQLMGGDMTVKSQFGQGATFSFSIPFHLASPVDCLPRSPDRRMIGLAPHHPPYRLLIVEDRWESRQLLVQLLQPLGFEIREAENGSEAIALWESWKPHLIWMDIRMPVVDGYEAIQRIREREQEIERDSVTQNPKTVIIALTASALEEERIEILKIGSDDFVRKPFHEKTILDKIAQHLDVNYLYASDEDTIVGQQLEIIPPSLLQQTMRVMPSNWIARLHESASLADNELIFQLLTEIPDSNAVLTDTLVQLVHDFRYDKIMQASKNSE
jgi:PAS domain S-box-containing protein